MTSSDMETAERVTRERARMLPVLALLLVTQQIAYFAEADARVRMVDHFKVGAWLLLSVVLLLALASGGFWLRSRKVRALVDDEGTRANRAEAFRVGFLITMIAGIALYVLDEFAPMRGRDAIHVLVTIGITSALIVFSGLERHALKDG